MPALGSDKRTGVLDADGLQGLIKALAADGCRVLGPTVRDGAIVYDAIESIAALPSGWTDRQEPGHYALERRSDSACFGYAVGPHSWKQFLFPPKETLWSASRGEDGAIAVAQPAPPAERFAFLGVRACELKAMAIQDRVLVEGPFTDGAYAARRSGAFVVAVNCTVAGGTCFCASMDAGPGVSEGYDLALTELTQGDELAFLVEAGSQAGADMLARVPHVPASDAQLEAARARVKQAASAMGRTLDTDGIGPLLKDSLAHPRWEEVASRCLTCGNCTMVCPTCFCTTVEDSSDLAGRSAERVRTWDSCFTLDHSFLHGGSVRASTASRYRQWLTHKLATWIDQFGQSGCVGCGRCVTWCPVGIDLTEEVAAIRAAPDKASHEAGRG